MTDQADVVISGAGPNGLLVAGELALAGVRPVVLEQLAEPSTELKANGIVGQANRVLDLRGLYQPLSGSDEPPQPMDGYIFAGMQVPFVDVVDNPMYGMLIQQPRVVRQLVDWVQSLGVEIRWGHELIDLEQGSDGVTLDIAAPAGNYQLQTTYLVGADGGRSQVRKSAGIEFPGLTTDVVARVAHVSLPDELRAGYGALNVPGVGHIPFGHNRFDGGVLIYAEFQPGRGMVGTIEYGSILPDDAPELTIDELRASVKRVVGADLPIQPPRGPGPHALRRINGQNTRQADRYRAGNVFLVGDAAHVHSAMGGPGLNLGMQDAMNLGWKLAAAVHGRAPDGLLDSYHSERWPAGQRVMMQSMAQAALMAAGPEVTALRTLFGELLATPDGSAHIAGVLSGSDVRYEVGDEHRLSGYFVPALTLSDGRRVAELLRSGRPVLLDLSGGDHAEAAAGWRGRLDIEIATIDDPPAAALLIRPDGYVAWAADGFGDVDRDRLHAALRRWFGSPDSEQITRSA
ncbi:MULTISPECIES: FAD-dependent monooxygenase [unclassified Mycolicibacterium]|uniref:FAD-dependent monooxygenase n=1 Tax=unclassified Mycolicibacterium TaxID=2636767 RepID=UPI0012DBD568|nr:MULTISPECIES: FAD-dependent monooxygenase [unclassified Mycolicibacterium]MUL81176.1 FAD-dependent oxidoreductase [Mycolicibacterium sp. CBMA 329]MUL86942.1 FAD-dependent oxidoreductase [Mycolicibacterium sp. CBMA 331]MUL98774.1 FAD-dependent oxidoreductase [Mycolicibacterium sp. CBMA 334]MUM25634.1 FAD-dependent oxidoreductase [Mycolicibacterium sp. CBMA 295]MUM37239.1 FAD-dependent oxidoreductase [Mycolicibacterium sp. CBMA 247]